MIPAPSRRVPNTLRIYGASGAAVLAWWLVLLALGIADQPTGKILLGVAAVIGLVYALLRDPFGIICLVIFAIPFCYGILQFEIGVITLNPFTVGIIAAMIAGVMSIAFGSGRYRVIPEDIMILLLGASFLLSTLLAPDILEAGFLAFHAVFIPITTYFAVRIFVRSPSRTEQVLIAYIAGATAFALYGLVQFMQVPERLFVLNMPPISAAAIMTAALIVLIHTGWWRTKLGALASIALLAGVVVTFSRGYLVLLLLSPLFFRAFSRGMAGTLMALMLATTLVITVLLSRSAALIDVESVDRQYEQTAQRISDLQYWINSLASRAQYCSIGLDEFAKSPIIGNGFHRGFDGPGGSAVVWHNFHVEWLEYGGLSAYLLYVALLVMHFRSMASTARWNRSVTTGLTVVFAILLNGLTNSFTAGISPVLGFLFMALNRAAVTGQPPPATRAAQPQPRPSAR